MTTTFVIYPTTPVASVGRKMRAAFTIRAYAVLFVALLAFMLIQLVFLQMKWGSILAGYAARFPWYATLGAFVAGGWMAVKAARHATSFGAQYASLLLFVIVESILFAPLVHWALGAAPGVGLSATAAGVIATLGVMFIAFTQREEFKFGKACLMWIAMAALAVGLAGLLQGFNVTACVTAGLVVLAALIILHTNIEVLQEYSRDRYIAAALELFACIPLLPVLVLRKLFSSGR
ncbi:MAG: hypothetical protein V1929_06950 [bacterium]